MQARPHTFVPVVSLAAVGLLLSLPIIVGAQTVPLAEYQTLLREYSRAAQKPLSPDAAAAFKQRFLAARTVTLPDNTMVQPDNAPIYRDIDTALRRRKTVKLPPDAMARADTLASLIVPADTTRPAFDAHGQAQAILNRTEFHNAAAPKPKNSWLDDQREKLQKWLESFFRWLFKNRIPATGMGKGGEWLASLVQWLLVLFAMVAMSVGVWYLARWFVDQSPAKRKRAGVLSGFDLTEAGMLDPLGASRQLAAEGDYRGALRLAYIASLRRLAESGQLVLQENKTNWEYQRDLQGRSPLLYRALLPATRLFDLVWYGERTATQEEYAVVVAAHDQLDQLDKSAASGATTGGAA